MFDTPEILLEKVRLGEDSFLELKEVRLAGSRVSAPHRDSLADELAAFGNSRGGVLVLGVEDGSREILGIPPDKLDSVVDFVRQLCRDAIQPPLNVLVERVTLPNTMGEEVAILKVEVERSLWVHKSAGGYMHRVADEKREMEPDFLARLFQQRSQSRIIRFDEQAVPDARPEDLSENLWQRFATARTRNTQKELLQKLGLASMDEAQLRPSVAGILMASNSPEQWLPNAFIQAVAYRGVDVRPDGENAYQLDAADITGPLDRQIAGACAFVQRNMRVSASKQGGRRDCPQFDMTAVFEAMVNAVAHRDYSMHGAKIRLRLFADRLELYSPGAIPNTMTVDSLAFRQSARNETLTSLLAKCPVPNIAGLGTDRATIMDKRGEGVSIIFQNSERLSGYLPQYRLIDGSELQLVIHAASVSA